MNGSLRSINGSLRSMNGSMRLMNGSLRSVNGPLRSFNGSLRLVLAPNYYNSTVHADLLLVHSGQFLGAKWPTERGVATSQLGGTKCPCL